MRLPKNVVNAFAILGVVSFIVFACAAAEEAMSNDDPVVVNDPNDDTNDDPNDDPNNELPITVGKYQMQVADNRIIKVLDTETGAIKIWVREDAANADWNLDWVMVKSFQGW